VFEFIVSSLTVAGIYALMALGLNLQAGYAGLLNFGHIVFAGIGAYSTGIFIREGWGAFPGAVAGVCLAVGLGWIIARLGRELGADYWAIVTLAIAEIIRTVANNETWLTEGAQGIGNLPSLFNGWPRPYDSIGFLVFTFLMVLLAALFCRRLGNGRLGRALRVMREQPGLAACMGYNLTALKSRALMSAAAVTAIGGSLYAHFMSFVGPDYMMASETFLLWTMVMIGGLGNTAGVIVGVILVQGAYTMVPFARQMLGFGSDMAASLRLGLIGLILLSCLLWRTEGLLPERLRKVKA